MKTASGPLREGFSTGTAAAAAARAAVGLLCGGALPARVEVALPPFAPLPGGCGPESGLRLSIAVDRGGQGPDGWAWAEVVKDGGDDPDATHGARVRVRAAFTPFTPSAATQACPPVAVTAFAQPVVLYAGQGIGRVTLPGLPVPPGEPAINPQPRLQIAFAALEALEAFGPSDIADSLEIFDAPEAPAIPAAQPGPAFGAALHLEISIADGEKRAGRTMNARLGIVGGLSVLGTRGTVRPYSHEAWQAAISQGLDVAAALGLETMLLATGRRSERLGHGLYPQLPPQAGIQVADFAAHALRGAAGRGFARLVWLCFPGKLLKLAQGLEWTHAKAGRADLALLARLCAEHGGGPDLLAAVKAMPTAAGAFVCMRAENRPLHDAVLRHLGHMAYDVVQGWLGAVTPPAASPPRFCLHVFSLEQELLLTLPQDAACAPARAAQPPTAL